MADSDGAFNNLVAHAHDAHFVIVGGGIAGLTFAYECAKVGIAVTLFEKDDELGGTIASVELDGVRIDTGATSWQAKSPAMSALIAELGLQDRVVTPARDQVWIADPARGWAAPLPADTVLGIPANTWDESVRRVIGWGGTWRAYLDRLRPPLTIGVSRNLGALVRSRMGEKVRDRLVAPLTFGRFGIAPEDVDVDIAAPGLNTALTRTGSLGGAVSDLLVDRNREASIHSLDGGMPQLVEALRARLVELGVVMRTGATVTAVERSQDAHWQVHVEAAEGDVHESSEVVHNATVVVLATPEAISRDLAAQALGRPLATAPANVHSREIVTLVLAAPALDAAAQGTEVYAVPGSSRASGIVHQTARWQWLERETDAGRHVVSVAFDTDGDPAGVTDAEFRTSAVEAASALLGVALNEAHVRGMHRARFVLDQPKSTRDHAERRAGVRSELAEAGDLVAVGAWLSGSGLAQVVADAVSEADRIRSAVLWGEAGGD
ncbi:protoporphyrinogen/coproporphyrinogen oxidase [Microbacterium sp. R86528]|uniref:protoporphyrinogen/coproporphyrinogen oxidase n=1 Tax=Microbacterium sp. R86528 TaxID=3093864 RepID=UPI0037C6CDDA